MWFLQVCNGAELFLLPSNTAAILMQFLTNMLVLVLEIATTVHENPEGIAQKITESR